jgi:glucan phosphorylase
MMSEDMPWVIGLSDEEVQELRKNKQELTEYGKNKIRKLLDEYSKQNKKPTLWEIMRDQLGFSIDMCDEIVDAVEGWLPPQHETNDYQWNKCIDLMKEKLR